MNINVNDVDLSKVFFKLGVFQAKIKPKQISKSRTVVIKTSNLVSTAPTYYPENYFKQLISHCKSLSIRDTKH